MKLIKPVITAAIFFAPLLFIDRARAQNVRPPFEATTDPSTWKGVALPLKLDADAGTDKRVLKQSDFDYAAKAGANVIRLAVHADAEGKINSNKKQDKPASTFEDKDGNVIDAAHSPGIADLKAAAAMAAKDGIKLIIDMHAAPHTNNGRIFTNQADWDNFKKIWVEIAATFKNNPNVIAFDLMNEPKLLNGLKLAGIKQTVNTRRMFRRKWSIPDSWNGTPRDYTMQMTNVIKAIRQADPDRTVIVEGFGIMGNPSNFVWMKPILGLKNVVYSAHVYQPILSTMIGMSNFKKKNSEGVRFNYPADQSKLDTALAPIIAFQKKYNVPIYIGEFGVSDDAVYKSDSTGQSFNGSCWIVAIIKTMNANHFGWTYWDFWNKGRRPLSEKDPRFIVLSAAMHHKELPDYCSVKK
jgi:aryl-phospho-beta-D-glucosidase BglC (GH1 family)